jgi:arabinofuranosyltransferase
MANSDKKHGYRPCVILEGLAGAALCWRYLLVAGVALAMVALFLKGEFQVAGGPGFPLDDSWIHARFAQNLVRGQGFSFNPGVPSAGSTAPLWTLLLAGGHALSGEFVWTAKALGSALFILSAVLLGRLAEEVSEGGRAIGLLAGLTAAICGPLIISALSGMETALYGCLTALGLYTHVRWRDEAGWRAFLPTMAFALATMTRPECGLLLLFSLLDRAGARLRAWRPVGAMVREVILHSLAFAGAMLPYALFYLMISGRPYPHTFTVKIGATPIPLWQRALQDLTAQFGELPSLGLGLALLVPLGLLTLARRPRSGVLFLTIFLFPPLRQWLAPFRYFGYQVNRYYIHSVEVLVVVGVVGLMALPAILGQLGTHSGDRFRLRMLLIGLGGSLLLTCAAGAWAYQQYHSRAVGNINDMQVALGRWLAEHTGPQAALAVNDIGAIAVFSDREIIDAVGLTSPEVTAHRQQARQLNPTDPVAEERGLLAYLIERKPDYLVIFPEWYPWLSQRSDLFEPLYYVQLKNNLVCGSDLMIVYRTVWADQ